MRHFKPSHLSVSAVLHLALLVCEYENYCNPSELIQVLIRKF